MTIDEYVGAVDRHLTMTAAAKASALDDLRAALRDAGSGSYEDALATFGPPADYAAALADEAERRPPTLLGMPNSFLPGIARRVAGTFDSADRRVLVPRVFGAGWTFNSGAIAARLGLLNADDLDDEIAAEAVEGPGRRVRLAASLLALAALLRSIGAVASCRATPVQGVALVGLAATSAGLAAGSASPRFTPTERLAMPGVAASLGVLGLGLPLTQRSRTRTLATLALAGTASFAAKVLPLRAAVASRVRA